MHNSLRRQANFCHLLWKLYLKKKKKDLTYYTHHTEERYEVDPENGKRRQNLKHLGPSDETEWLRLKWKTEKISAYLVCVDPTLGNQIKTHKKLNMTLFFFIGQCKTECKFSGKMTQCTGQTDGEIEWKKRCNLVYGLNRVCALVRPSHIKDCKTSDLSTVYSFHFSVSAELLPSLVLTARTVHATNL